MNAPTRKDMHADPISLGLLDPVLPMHVLIAPDKTIRHAGPTLEKMAARGTLTGVAADEVFDIRRPFGLDRFDDLLAAAGQRLTVALRAADDLPLRGVLVRMPDGGALIDLSLGLSFKRGVTEFGLTNSDFSPSDQTVELLYLHEANTVIGRLSRELTERVSAARETAEHQALTDPLTSLPNRRAVDQEMYRLLDDPHIDFTLLHLDLDYFKQVNDALGHAAGDHVLSVVAKVLKSGLRHLDMAARTGGDEFLIILRDTVAPEDVASVIDRLIRKIERPIPFEDNVAKVSASVGAVSSTTYTKRPDADRMLAHADAALYRAKNAGRATFALHGVPEVPERRKPGVQRPD